MKINRAAAAGRRVAFAAALALAACQPVEPFRVGDPLANAGPPGAEPAAAQRAAPPPPAAASSPIAARAAARGFVRRGSPPRPSADRRRGAAETSAPSAGGDEISLDFEDADLASVVRLFMQDGLGADYIIDPGVSGSVTLRTNRPLAPSQLLPTLEEILRLNDAALVFRNGVYRILPRAQAGLTSPVIGARAAAARGLVVTVTPLRFVAADEITDVLDGFAPVAGAIRYDRARNLVFVIGDTAEQQTIQDVIATLDVNFFAGRSIALTPLRQAAAGVVAEELAVLFASPSGAPNPAIRFIPVERMGAVLTVAERQELLDEALILLRNLDQGLGVEPTLHVYAVSNRRASELAELLGRIFNAEVEGAAAAAAPVAPGLEVAAAGTAAETAGDPETPRETFGGARSPSGGARLLTGERPRFATGFDFEADRVFAGVSGAGVSRIVADEASNAIVALATPDGARAVEAALRRLDVQPLQVQIEATLLQVELNDRLEYGVRWFLESGDFSVGFNDAAGAATGALFPGFNAAFETSDARVTISALDAVTDVRVLSAPTLMVLDNQVARLQVGDQVPVTTRSAQSTADPDAPLVTETEFRDTGVILEIRPTVSAGGLVTLEMRQETSDVVATAGDDNPTFAQRVIESTVAVQSGETVAIAGLIEEDATIGRDGIPILSRIPVLGAAFSTTVERGGRSELLVLIRPVVVRDQSDARAVTEELRRKLSNLGPRPVGDQ